MFKLISVTLLFMMFSWASLADRMTFCSGSDIDMTPASENCLTTCTAVAGRSASYLPSNTAGYCVGQASYSKFIIYRLMLGQNSSGSEAKCTIWSGTLPVTLSSKSAGDKATGGACRQTMLNSGLAQGDLSKIWQLSDIDGDGCLDRDEFALCMFLMEETARGKPLPDALQQACIPPSKR